MNPVGQRTFKLLLLWTAAMAFAVNPGVKLRLTNKAISYVSTVAEVLIKADLQTLTIPDQSGQEGRVSWSFTNIQTLSVNSPTSQISLNPPQGGLTWSLSKFSVSLKANWHVKYKQGWVKVSDSGSVNLVLNDVSLTVTAGFGQKDGRPSISSKGCSTNIGDISVDFHGGTAFILNLLKGIVKSKIRDGLQNRICDIVNKEINVDAEEYLSKLPVYLEIDHRFLLDYGLVANPVVTSNYLELLNKGEMYWKSDQQECPFSADTIPDWSDDSNMLYFWFTQYSAKTAAYVAQTHGYLKYNLTKRDFPANQSGYLDTNCQTSMCIGKLIPQIANKHPESWVELRISSTAIPEINITKDNITAQAWADIDLFAHMPDETTMYLLTLNMTLSLTANGSIDNAKLIATIIGHKFDAGVVKSAIGHVDPKRLRIFIEGALTFSVIPQLNKLGKAGIALPVPDNLMFLNTKLTLFDGLLLVATDVQYQSNLAFVPEMQLK